jgi:hypothetical protein
MSGSQGDFIFVGKGHSQIWGRGVSTTPDPPRFINVICVGIRSSLPKRRYRVVIDYEGDLLRHRGKA